MKASLRKMCRMRSRRQKADDMERVTGRHARLIRLLRGPLTLPRRQQRSAPTGGLRCGTRRIYESYGCICAEPHHHGTGCATRQAR